MQRGTCFDCAVVEAEIQARVAETAGKSEPPDGGRGGCALAVFPRAGDADARLDKVDLRS